MALANFMQTGTYSTVSVIGYDKHRKNVSFCVNVYTDSTKTKLLNSVKYFVNNFNSVTVKSRSVTNPDDVVNPQAGDKYIVPENATGLWALWKNEIIYWDTEYNGWQLYVEYAEGDDVEVEDEKLWVRSENKKWVAITVPNKASNWTNYFDSSLFNNSNMDLIKGIYLYLKNERPEFANAVDA